MLPPIRQLSSHSLVSQFLNSIFHAGLSSTRVGVMSRPLPYLAHIVDLESNGLHGGTALTSYITFVLRWGFLSHI